MAEIMKERAEIVKGFIESWKSYTLEEKIKMKYIIALKLSKYTNSPDDLEIQEISILLKILEIIQGFETEDV